MIDIDPNSSGLPGIAQLQLIVDSVTTLGLTLASQALIISSVTWGTGELSNPHLAVRHHGRSRCRGCGGLRVDRVALRSSSATSRGKEHSVHVPLHCVSARLIRLPLGDGNRLPRS